MYVIPINGMFSNQNLKILTVMQSEPNKQRGALYALPTFLR